MVLFLQPLIPWGSRDDAGTMDIGRLDASVYPAVQNFCIAARSLGLGTALTTVIRIHSEEVLELLGVPSRDDGSPRFEIAALLPVGYPVGKFGVAPRKPAAAVTHWNTWGNKRRGARSTRSPLQAARTHSGHHQSGVIFGGDQSRCPVAMGWRKESHGSLDAHH